MPSKKLKSNKNSKKPSTKSPARCKARPESGEPLRLNQERLRERILEKLSRPIPIPPKAGKPEPVHKIIRAGTYHLSSGAILTVIQLDGGWAFVGERDGVLRHIKFSDEAVAVIKSALDHPFTLLPVRAEDLAPIPAKN